jgi:antitoxin component of MazEF toxin-antitoxin module
MGVTPKDVARRDGVGEKWVRQLAREEIARHGRHTRWVWPDWNDAELAHVLNRLESGRGVEDVEEWEAIISSKNQITLPVAALRALNLKPGHRLRLVLKENALAISPAPASWTDYYAGVANGLYGRNEQAVDTYIRESRGEWEPIADDDLAHESPQRWGDKSILIERQLAKQAVRVVDQTGVTHKVVPNFSAIARQFGVTREFVRQIAADLGIESRQRTRTSIKQGTRAI